MKRDRRCERKRGSRKREKEREREKTDWDGAV